MNADRNMPDREKVMRGLMHHSGEEIPIPCDNCPYVDEPYCSQRLAADALALLKEHDEGVTPIESTTEQKKFADRIGFAVSEYWCGDCHFNLFNRPKFCPNCGRKVKWDA